MELGEGCAFPVLLPKGRALLVPVSVPLQIKLLLWEESAPWGHHWEVVVLFIDSEAMDIAQLGEKGFVSMERKER